MDLISKFEFYEISNILLGEEKQIGASDLVPNTMDNKMKILCLQLAGQDYGVYKELYYNTRAYDVYELKTLISAINWRPSETGK